MITPIHWCKYPNPLLSPVAPAIHPERHTSSLCHDLWKIYRCSRGSPALADRRMLKKSLPRSCEYWEYEAQLLRLFDCSRNLISLFSGSPTDTSRHSREFARGDCYRGWWFPIPREGIWKCLTFWGDCANQTYARWVPIQRRAWTWPTS